MRSLIVCLLVFVSLQAQSITIFAASDLKFALDTIKTNFLQTHPDDTIKIIYGSSGKGRTQIARGAPYHLYFSANMNYVDMLYVSGDIATKPKLYAIGRLVLWSKNKNFQPKEGFANLTQSWAKKVAIANPSHAPYGEKAQQALVSKKLYQKIKNKIILGENISQTANFINIQAADIGIIALSLVKSPAIQNSPYNNYYLIDDSLHKPLYQGYGITRYGAHSQLARQFYTYFQTPQAQRIMQRYGFSKTKE